MKRASLNVSGVSSESSSTVRAGMREALEDFTLSASFASRSAEDSDTIFCEIYTPGYPPQKKGSFGFYVKDLRLILAALSSQPVVGVDQEEIQTTMPKPQQNI